MPQPSAHRLERGERRRAQATHRLRSAPGSPPAALRGEQRRTEPQLPPPPACHHRLRLQAPRSIVGNGTSHRHPAPAGGHARSVLNGSYSANKQALCARGGGKISPSAQSDGGGVARRGPVGGCRRRVSKGKGARRGRAAGLRFGAVLPGPLRPGSGAAAAAAAAAS